ncbi:DUF2306 domain-containing protein [Actinomadura rayongensis]|uniref:DUF2306 domain-containing protein n=2 Tax=Actinomadura rayongensis TaxID=1429076 RepID=A0A6I4W9Z6_9ACTN|nr:DUF2306 domain-containing protein [Actinomadura rayongensis]
MDGGRVEAHGVHYALLVTHIFTAFVALVLGPLQFLPAVRARRRVHRVLGRCYVFAGVLPSAAAGVPVALLSGRLLTQIGLTIPALLWPVTAFLAVRAARRGDHAAHRDWMTRNYALTFLAVTSRILVPFLLLARLAIEGTPAGGRQALVDGTIPVGQALGWIVNLVLVEYLIRRRRAAAPAVPPSAPRPA